MKTSRFLLPVLLLFASLNGFAQQYNFRNYSVPEGLAQSQVYALCEDQRGYLWMGTRGGGACRFDGKNFVSFTEENGLSSNFIRCIYEDKKGTLWFGTDEGICTYDGQKFIRFSADTGHTGGMINAIAEDRKGNFWFGTEEHGALRYDGKNITAYTTAQGLPHNRVHCFYTDKNNKVWIGTETSLATFDGDTVKTVKIRPGVGANIIHGIAEDKQGNIWFASYGGGVHRYDGEKFTTLTIKEGLANNTTNCVMTDKGGNLWFGTAIGASRYNPADSTFTTFTDLQGLSGNVVMCLRQDVTGNMWLGTSGGGVSRFDSERFLHFNDRNGKIGAWVYAVHQDSLGIMWFGGGSGGVTTYDGQIFTRYSRPQGFTDSKVRCIFEDRNHHLWFGTSGEGAYEFDGKVFKHLLRKDGLTSNFVNAIVQDTSGKIWLGTLAGGLCCYDPETRKFIKYNFTGSLGSDRIAGLYRDEQNDIWVATQYGGVSRVVLTPDTTLGEIVSYNSKTGLAKTTVRSVMGMNGRIFFGTAGKGLVVVENENSWSVTKKNGFSSNNIYSLIADSLKNLWVGTEKGIDKIEFGTDGKVKSIRHYGKAEGFTGSETSQNGACLDSLGRLWFGTINGATRYDPKEDHLNSTPPRVHLTGIRLAFDKIEDTRYRDSLSRWFPVPARLELPYYMNNISFDFIAINLRNPESVRYKWRLENYDKKSSPETELQMVTYSNLPPGHFIFKVTACNEDGLWSEEKQFEFTIQAPYWKTWWFRIGVIATGILLIVGAFSIRISYLKRKNERIREKLEFKKNLAELEQKALRLQMNPHFIFNALNSIQGSISHNETAEAKRHLAKFSKLMRQILESSREKYIPVEEEVSILSNYLDLEKISSGTTFEYSIQVDPAIDEMTAIPGMIIQPFVENAVLHGVRGRTDGKITIFFKKLEDVILCEVSDNGIGINQAAERKKETSTEHKSAGIDVTEERLRLISKNPEQQPVKFEDLSASGSNGTKVTLRLPFVHL